VWDHKTVSQAYQHRTLIYAASSLTSFSEEKLVAEIDAHAPELLDANGKIYISSAEYPQRGINLAKLKFI